MMHSILIFSILSALTFGCTTPDVKPEKQNSKDLLNQGKKKRAASIELPNEPASPEPTPVPSEELSLFIKLSDLRSTLTTSDIQSLRRISATLERSPLSRAILLFGVLRSYLHLGVEPVLFDQAALVERTPVQGKNWTKMNSLEELLQETKLTFKEELDNNPFAQTLSIVELALRALDQETDRAQNPFNIELREELHEKATQWSRVREKIAVIPPAQATVGTSPEQTAVPASTTALGMGTVPMPSAIPPTTATVPTIQAPDPATNPSAYTESELLKKSSELAEKSRYYDAIQILRHIEATSPYYSEAKGKILDFSNKAVGELRTKAARSYQSAVPISDLRARANYLSEAESYLLKAIEQFPDSDQIETVKQNLSTIQKSLKVINKN